MVKKSDKTEINNNEPIDPEIEKAVKEAMKKAGVFGENLTPKKPQVQSSGKPTPIDTGTRKAAQSGAPAPNLSSTQQPRVTPTNGDISKEQQDYSTMSDEDFLKLKPPS
jgi:hypothetical protein